MVYTASGDDSAQDKITRRVASNACGNGYRAPPLPDAQLPTKPLLRSGHAIVTDTTVAVDFGASNTDIVIRNRDGLHYTKVAGSVVPTAAHLRDLLVTLGIALHEVGGIAVTGGNRRALPETLDGVSIVQVEEVTAIGRGGLALAHVDRAIVTSAGSGTAVVSAEPDGCRHVTGTGVGGGTLVGLGRMLLGETNPITLDTLARAGSATGLNLTIGEVLGGAIGTLPADITAVNFGRVARAPVNTTPEDTAAALVNMIGQVIAVIALNAAKATRHSHIVIVGHLTDLPSVRDTLLQVGELYHTPLLIPEHGGFATATGALIASETLPSCKNA